MSKYGIDDIKFFGKTLKGKKIILVKVWRQLTKKKKKEKETTQNPLGEKKTKLLGPVKFNLF